MQLLFEFGEEDGINKGLGIIKGRVSKIKIKNNEKLPHVGWNTLSFVKKHFILQNLKEHVDYYFVHSYECIPNNKKNLIVYTDYGGKIAACVSNNKNVDYYYNPEIWHDYNYEEIGPIITFDLIKINNLKKDTGI